MTKARCSRAPRRKAIFFAPLIGIVSQPERLRRFRERHIVRRPDRGRLIVFAFCPPARQQFDLLGCDRIAARRAGPGRAGPTGRGKPRQASSSRLARSGRFVASRLSSRRLGPDLQLSIIMARRRDSTRPAGSRRWPHTMGRPGHDRGRTR